MLGTYCTPELHLHSSSSNIEGKYLIQARKMAQWLGASTPATLEEGENQFPAPMSGILHLPKTTDLLTCLHTDKYLNLKKKKCLKAGMVVTYL